MGSKFSLAAEFQAVDHMKPIIKQMEGEVSHFAKHAQGAMGTIKGIIGGAIAGLSVGVAFHELTEFAEKGDEISRTSRALGMSAESLQKLRYAAHLADIPAETLTGALKKMNLNLGQLTTRQGALYTHLSRTNPALARQLYATKDSNKAFLLLMDAINHTSNAQERAALTVAAFGKSGQEMLPLIMEGSKGIADMGEEAQKLGLVMSDNTAKAGEKFSDSLKRIKAVGQGLLYQVLGPILQKMAPLIERFADWAIKDDHLIKLLPALGLGILGAIVAVNALTVAFAAMDAAADANPIGLIVVAVEAMAVAVAAVIIYWRQITDALKSAWTWFDKLYNKSLALRAAFFFLASPVWLVIEAIRTLIDLLSGRGLKSFENFIPPWLKGATDALGMTRSGGGELGGAPSGAPVSSNTRGGNMRWNGHIWVHAEPGTGVSGKPGGTPSPSLTLNPGWAATK